MSGREVTNAELAEDIAQLRSDLRDFRVWANESLVDKEVYQAHRDAASEAAKVVDHRLTTVEGRQTNIARTAVTALILPVAVPILVAMILVTISLAQNPVP